MKIIITEQQVYIIRRLRLADEIMKDKFDEVYPISRIKELCGYYIDEDTFFDMVFEYIWEVLSYNHLGYDVYMNEENYYYFKNYVTDKWGEVIRQRYKKACSTKNK